MKRIFSYTVLFAAAVVIIPAIPMCLSGKAGSDSGEVSAIATDELVEVPIIDEAAAEDYYKVLDVSTGEIINVPEKDYIVGAVCAEMPATFETEALKAQAVAAHTYAERQRLRELENPTPELCGADFSNDTSKYQGYFTENQAKQYYGENFDMNYSKIKTAADEVSDYIITYNDEPIISAFHSMSSGKTESAEKAWGSAVDYLVPVDSSFDTSAPKYLEEVRYSKDVLREKLTSSFNGINLGDDFTTWLSLGECSESGTVLSVNAGGLTISGNDLRTALALRSACFTIEYVGEEAVITTKGYGHGVGMSQYGANSMALDGSTWQEILQHYYSGCEITVES